MTKAPGSLALPPSSASAWNTGQSDGRPGKADRGIDDYRRIIDAHRERFRSCYDTAFSTEPGAKGTITLTWILSPTGAVADGAGIDKNASDFYSESLERCMVAALKSLSFPPSTRKRESTVRYPFGFQPGTDAE